MSLLGYARALFRDFESYLRIVLGLDQDDIQLILKEYTEKFIAYQLSPGIHTIEDISKSVYTMGDRDGTLQIENDDNDDDDSVKTKLISTRFGSTFGTLRFDKKSFFHTLLGFAPYWDYKPTNPIHADSPGVYTNDKFSNLNAIIKNHLKCDVVDGSLVNRLRQPILFSFILDKPPGYKILCEPETIHYKKINKSVLNTKTFYLEDDNNEVVNFNGETLTFTLRMIKI